MSANLGLLIQEPGEIAAITLGFLLLKIVAISAVGWVGRCRREALNPGFTLAAGGEFAFVLFTLALRQRILDSQTTDQLILAVTLSMIAAPLLLSGYEMIAKRLMREPARPFDRIEDEENRVIIAGFGRVGQIVARVLRARRIPFTALDISQTHVDFVRRALNIWGSAPSSGTVADSVASFRPAYLPGGLTWPSDPAPLAGSDSLTYASGLRAHRALLNDEASN